ncbi:hypothetical protein DPMN_140788 [Dreissena polymorpha]|uniref:Uncharacterized protein n=1 Tax=Dreissena polymorpha TaxID=45954 RepID=A0A9D4JKP1_DREPO|nr:hypothetical protein DPMN_140788 [Dreissena polymorpha]
MYCTIDGSEGADIGTSVYHSFGNWNLPNSAQKEITDTTRKGAPDLRGVDDNYESPLETRSVDQAGFI